jgi:putative DNA primase/helicase
VFEDKLDREMLIAFLQRLLGYAITGATTEHIFPILYGEEGRNGKDTLLSTLESVLGPLVGAVSNDVFIASDRLRSGGAATPHLCDLQGKWLVWGSETKQGDKLTIAQIKLLTGGGAISTRQLHGKQYTFTPTHKLLLMTNYKPHADARDKAFWSRACLIEFGIRFVDQPQAPNERRADHDVKAVLKAELSGILPGLFAGAWPGNVMAWPFPRRSCWPPATIGTKRIACSSSSKSSVSLPLTQWSEPISCTMPTKRGVSTINSLP